MAMAQGTSTKFKTHIRKHVQAWVILGFAFPVSAFENRALTGHTEATKASQEGVEGVILSLPGPGSTESRNLKKQLHQPKTPDTFEVQTTWLYSTSCKVYKLLSEVLCLLLKYPHKAHDDSAQGRSLETYLKLTGLDNHSHTHTHTTPNTTPAVLATNGSQSQNPLASSLFPISTRTVKLAPPLQSNLHLPSSEEVACSLAHVSGQNNAIFKAQLQGPILGGGGRLLLMFAQSLTEGLNKLGESEYDHAPYGASNSE
eukprot:6461962-Amphidinium_carterae.1